MGKGKAKRRRQSNYEKAHSTGLQLAPPPSAKDVTAVPRKLQAIVQFMNPQQQQKKKSIQGKNVNENASVHKKTKAPKKPDAEGVAMQKNVAVPKEQLVDQGTEELAIPDAERLESAETSKSRKRKRNAALEQFGERLKSEEVGIKTRERRKKYLKERKDKQKKKKKKVAESEENQLYKREDVKFGEVVQAPPKLTTPRKNKAGSLGPSQQRLRLQAVEAYRQRRAWESRPGTAPAAVNQA